MKNKKTKLQKCFLGMSLDLSISICIGVMICYYFLIASSFAEEGSGREDDTFVDDIETLLGTDDNEILNEDSICPSLEEYEETKQSVVVTLINDTHVLIDWSNLWPDLTWRDCISQLVLLIDETEVKTISDVTKNVSELEIDLCKTHKVKIKGILAKEKEHFVYSNEETINPPEKNFLSVHSKIKEFVEAEKNAIVKTSYQNGKDLQANITCANIKADLSDLIEESACNRVKSMEIVLRKAAQASKAEWIVKNQIEISSKENNAKSFQLHETVCGLSDFCSGYEIGLRVKETTKPDLTQTDIVVPLTSIGPLDFANSDLVDSISNQDLQLEGPNGLELLYSQPNSIALQWDKNDKSCFSGYAIQLKNNDQQQILGKHLPY